MRLVPILGAAAAVTLAGCSSLPSGGAKEAQEHAAHHQAQSASKVDVTNVDRRMKMMHDMHQKMHAAQTPEERSALMKDHMKAMQDGVAMMAQMKDDMSMQDAKTPSMGGAMQGTPHDMMVRRMDMMEMMMQMMMDRDAVNLPAAK
jgi:hypothetical protein